MGTFGHRGTKWHIFNVFGQCGTVQISLGKGKQNVTVYALEGGGGHPKHFLREGCKK